MIQEYAELGPDSGIVLQCEKNCVRCFPGRQWEKRFQRFPGIVSLMRETHFRRQKNLLQQFKKQTIIM